MSTELALAKAEVLELVAADLEPKPGVVGAAFPLSPEMLLPIAKGILEAIAAKHGDAAAAYILKYKGLISQLLGPSAIGVFDKVIHGLPTE